MTTHVVDFAPLAYCERCRVPLNPPFPDVCACGEAIHKTGQVGFFESKAPYPFFVGGAGSGKTKTGANKHLAFIIESGAPGLAYAPLWNKHMLMATLPAYLEIWEKYPKECHAGSYHVTERRLPIRTKHGNVVDLWFRSIDEPASLLGPTLGSSHIDECCQKDAVREAFDNVDMRLRAPLPAGMVHQHILTGTPKGVDHWTFEGWGDPWREHNQFEELLSRGEPDRVAREKAKRFCEERPFWTMHQAENIYLPKARVEMWEERYGGTPYGQQEIHAEWVVEGEGCIFQEDWFRRYDDFPDNVCLVVDSWDTAATKTEWATYTVGQTWLVTDEEPPHYYIVNMDRLRLQYAEVKIAIEGRQKLSGASFALVENKGGGQTAIQELSHKGVRVRAFNPGTADKFKRANDAAMIAREGRIHLPSRQLAIRKKMDWLPAFEREVFQAPYNKYWDIVDAMSQMILSGEAHRWASRLRTLPEIHTRIGHGVRIAV